MGWRAVGAAAEGQNISTSLGRCRFVTGDDDDNDDASNKRRLNPEELFSGETTYSATAAAEVLVASRYTSWGAY